jgi:hypothetical protein
VKGGGGLTLSVDVLVGVAADEVDGGGEVVDIVERAADEWSPPPVAELNRRRVKPSNHFSDTEHPSSSDA